MLCQLVYKMSQFSVLVMLAVLCAFFVEIEANPFVYNYERLRIGGLIIAGLLVAGGLFVLLNPKCTRKNKKSEDDTSEL
uniref:FXYD domain-containing ion transport regulator n=2 Tax=Oncorhynchus tshawytscha TaxID=74940 RepID=A0AAZ3PD82_ONCTS